MGSSEQPPKTVEEIGVHIYYINQNITNIMNKLESSPDRKEFSNLTNDLENHIKTAEAQFVKRSEIDGLLRVWGFTTSSIGKIFVMSLIGVLIFVSYQSVKEAFIVNGIKVNVKENDSGK